MSSEITPQELLEIAQRVEGDREWRLIMHDYEVAYFKRTGREFIHYEPHRNTERGRAQLMEVVFAVLEKARHFDFCYCPANKIEDAHYYVGLGQEHYFNGWEAEGKTKADAILSLAHEVLCDE